MEIHLNDLNISCETQNTDGKCEKGDLYLYYDMVVGETVLIRFSPVLSK
jgi:hypothetical protein